MREGAATRCLPQFCLDTVAVLWHISLVEEVRRTMNCLKGVFWDYPQFDTEEKVSQALSESKGQGDIQLYRWIMRRFLECCRVVDTLKLFPVRSMNEHFPVLRLRPDTRQKWDRLIEVYRAPQ